MRKHVARAGTELVVGAPVRAGADPVVHVSTFGALAVDGPGPIATTAAVGAPRETYLATKAEAEQISRGSQADGPPFVITSPWAPLGPHAPRLGDQTSRIRDTLRGLIPLWPLG